MAQALAVPRRLLAARAAQCAVICSDGPYSPYHHPVYHGTKCRDISIAEVTVFCGLQSAIRNAVTSLWYYSERQIVCYMTTPLPELHLVITVRSTWCLDFTAVKCKHRTAGCTTSWMNNANEPSQADHPGRLRRNCVITGWLCLCVWTVDDVARLTE